MKGYFLGLFGLLLAIVGMGLLETNAVAAYICAAASAVCISILAARYEE